MRGRLIITFVGVALSCIGAASEFPDDMAGSAFIGKAPTADEEAVDLARVAAAESYVACLETASDTWFSKPDFAACDVARAAYAAELAAEFADNAIGCLEEGTIGAPRVPGETCALLRRRLPDPIVIRSSPRAAP